MNRHDTTVRARIPQELKQQATLAFESMGLSLSDAIRLFFINVADKQRLPFEIKVPTKKTQDAIEELENGCGTKATSLKFMDKLNADD